MRPAIRDSIRYVLWLMVWILPLPFGMRVSGVPFLSDAGELLFIILSFIVPMVLNGRKRPLGDESVRPSVPLLLYGGFIGLFLCIAVIEGYTTQIHGLGVYQIVAEYIWMAVMIVVQYAISSGFTIWYDHRHAYWFSDFLDPILYALPLPCVLLGTLLFPEMDLAGTEGMQGVFAGLMIVTGSLSLFSAVWIMAVLVFYFVPSKKVYPRWQERLLRYVRIAVMGGVWVVLHWYFLSQGRGGVYDALPAGLLPLWSNSPMVFITPFVVESIALVLSIAVGNCVLYCVNGYSHEN